MGGNLAWTIRTRDGKEYRMDRWTNILSNGCTATISDAFLAGDQTAFDDALKSWLLMKADWETNQASKNFTQIMTPVYAPYPYGLRPSEYGIMITDFQTKTIITCQGYNSYGQMLVSKRMLQNNDDLHATITKIVNDGRITDILNDDSAPIAFNKSDLKAQANLIFKMAPTGMRFIKFAPPDGWTAKNYRDDDTNHRRKAYNQIIRLGFVLTDEEKKDFQKWIVGNE